MWPSGGDSCAGALKYAGHARYVAGVHSLLERKLLVVTGKGGVGKTTMAGAIGLAAAGRGLRTIVLDLTGSSARQAALFSADIGPDAGRVVHAGSADAGEAGAGPDAPIALAENLWTASIDPDRALLSWLQSLAGRVPARLLASKASFQYFAAAAPGAKELVCLVEVCALAGLGKGDTSGRSRDPGGARPYDLVVLDAPATGHALAMLLSPRTFAAIARKGTIAAQAESVRTMLEDPARTGYLAVAHANEMSVGETLDLQRELAEQLGASLDTVIVNATMQRRFTAEELERMSSLSGEDKVGAQERLIHAAVAAAHGAHRRTRFQHNQVARLRRHGLKVVQVPFVFRHDLELEALRGIAKRLDSKL
jgi:anion-transporting  ArsA/GET3 family ATPase